MSNGIRQERKTLDKSKRNVLLVAHAMASGEQCKVFVGNSQAAARNFQRLLIATLKAIGEPPIEYGPPHRERGVGLDENKTFCYIFTNRNYYDRWYAEYCLDDFHE